MRNAVMAAAIEAAIVDDRVRFAFAADSGAYPDPTADAIFAQLIRQVAAAEPDFFINLGDFAGPGTLDRHEAYLRLVDRLTIPNVCVVGNHDLDDAGGHEVWEHVHGPMNFSFGAGHTRFVAIRAAESVGRNDRPDEVPDRIVGPRTEDLEFLESALRAAAEPNRVVLMHMPPYFEGHYAPHANWGFGRSETAFLDILRTHGVTLVCCGHGLAFDQYVRDGIRFVMSGGGGTGICSHWRGVCAEGEGRPEDRGALFHFVDVSIAPKGTIAGRVVQAFADPGTARFTFGDHGGADQART